MSACIQALSQKCLLVSWQCWQMNTHGHMHQMIIDIWFSVSSYPNLVRSLFQLFRCCTKKWFCLKQPHWFLTRIPMISYLGFSELINRKGCNCVTHGYKSSLISFHMVLLLLLLFLSSLLPHTHVFLIAEAALTQHQVCKHCISLMPLTQNHHQSYNGTTQHLLWATWAPNSLSCSREEVVCWST